ncbi:MAG: hypothetical protein ABIN67_06495 [Ferruginibacter sp.]
MTELKEKVNALNQLILTGDTIKAIEIFYASDVEMQENEDAPTKGKDVCINTEKENLKRVKNIECTLLNQAIDEEKNIVFSEWDFLITYEDNNKFSLTEVSVQYWLAGQVRKEKFYYKSLRKID